MCGGQEETDRDRAAVLSAGKKRRGKKKKKSTFVGEPPHSPPTCSFASEYFYIILGQNLNVQFAFVILSERWASMSASAYCTVNRL